MAGTYEIGQKVLVEQVKDQKLSARDAALEPYTGKIGTIVDAHWINMGASARTFHIYTVRIENEDKEIVLHEDEIKAISE